MLRVKKAVFLLLIFSLIVPSMVDALVLKPILKAVSTSVPVESKDAIVTAPMETKVLDSFDLEKDLPADLQKIDLLSPEEIIENSKNNPQSYLASSWDQDYLLAEKADTTTAIVNNLSMDLFHGSAQYSYPLDLPAGRNGIGPQLSLAYNSQMQNFNDYMPFGWSLGGLMYIQRDSSNGVDALYQENHFVFSNGGALEAYALTDQIHGEYHLKLDDGQALRFFYTINNTWEFIDKNGVHYSLGKAYEARDFRGVLVYRWYLDSFTDSMGNNVIYNYKNEEGVAYPDSIIYSNWGTETGIYSIEFEYQDRTADYYSYKAGFAQNYKKQLCGISVFVNNTFRRYYRLTVADDNVALLWSILKWHYDENGNLDSDVYRTDFDYDKGADTAWQSKDLGKVDFSFLYPGDTQLLDINNDGFSDVLRAAQVLYNSGQVQRQDQAWLNRKGQDLALMTSGVWQIPAAFYTYYENGYSFFTDNKFSDINGDSYLDIINNGQVYLAKYFHNTQSASYIAAPNYTWWSHWYYVNNKAIERASLADLNGDGFSDYIFNQNRNTYLSKWADNDNNVLANWTQIPQAIIDAQNNSTGSRLIDLNKDSLADFVQSIYDESSGQTLKRVYLNAGNGAWVLSDSNEYDPVLPFAVRKTNGEVIDKPVFLIDIDNDGFLDFVNGETRDVYLFDKKSWKKIASNKYRLPITLFNGLVWADFRWGEANGQEGVDLWYLEDQAGDDHLIVYNNENPYQNLLTEITNEYGAKINLEYTSSALENENYGPNQALLKKVLVDDGFGQKQLEEYSYEGGEYFIDDVWQRGLNGYSKITRKAFDGHEEIYYFHQGNGVEGNVEHNDGPAYRGRIFSHEKYDKAGNILEVYYFNWKENLTSGFNFLQLSDETSRFCNSNGTACANKSLAYYYNADGNLQTVRDYGATTYKASSGEITDSDRADNLYINYEYAIDRKGNIRNVPMRLYILDANGDVLKDQRYIYDNLDYGYVSNALPSKEMLLQSKNKWIEKTNTYDKYGLLLSSTDFKGNRTDYEYDSYNLFLKSIRNPLGFKQSFTNDYFCGTVLKETDQNDLSLVKEYDAACRLTKFYRQNEKNGEKQLLQTLTYENKFPYKQEDYRYIDASGRYEKIISYYDGFKRKILQLVSLPNGNWQAVQYRYDQNGNLLLKSDYFEVSSDNWFPYNQTVFTEFTYDSLGRLIDFKDYHYWVRINYGLLEKSMNINGADRQFKFDIRGNVTELAAYVAGAVDHSYYEYDVLGRLNKYIDAAGNVRSWDYDNLDNLIYNEDAHGSQDNTFITWEYLWDENNNLLQKKISPAGISINYRYDKLNRVISEDDSTTAYLDYNYLYDAGSNGLGKLSSIKNADFEKAFNYDSFANLANANYLIKGNSYFYQYFYDYLGNPLSVIYPDKSNVNYEYNNNGQLQRSYLLEKDGKRQDILLDRQYNIWGAVRQESFGNGTTRSYLFNDRKNIDQEKIVDQNSRVLWQQDYETDWSDNLESFEISSYFLNGDVYNYSTTHDNFYRLSRAFLFKNTVLEKEFRYSYDAVNNLVSSSDYDFQYQQNNAAFNNPYAPTVMTAKVPGAKNRLFSYDQQGNVLSDGVNDYTWDAFNHLKVKKSSSGIVNYFYDENGSRLYRQDADIWTVFAGPYQESSDGEINARYNEFQIKETAKDGISKLFNYYDKFSNLVLQLDERANLLNYYIYEPFGQIYLSADSNRGSPYLFHKQEREGNLDYVQERYYDYEAMHWLSLDSAYENLPFLEIADLNHLLANPHLINPYAYLANSPWRYQDESGEVLETIIDLISIGFSFYDFVMDPSFTTGLLFLYDVGATLIPFLPASATPKLVSSLTAKAMFGGAKMTKALRQLSSHLGTSMKNAMKLVKTVANQLATKEWMARLAKWSPGKVGNKLLNFAIHYVKHIDLLTKFNIKSIDDYFTFSVSFLEKTGADKIMTDFGYFYKFMDGAQEMFYNPFKNLVIAISHGPDGKVISSFYEVTDPAYLNKFWSKVKDLVGFFWQSLLSIFSFSI